MINLDTDQLKNLLAQLESANNQIDEAMSLLQRVTTHTSWGCSERSQINERILQNRQQMQRIQQDSESFLNTTRSVADDFCATENNISSWFSSVDEAIAKVMSITLASELSSIEIDPNKFLLQHNTKILSSVPTISSNPLINLKLKDLNL